ncbi:hypothetical protein CI102_266 [Trichoderma harzianum]|nr:hypothetical protein CI102_266 [Trichoderma harzianum]
MSIEAVPTRVSMMQGSLLYTVLKPKQSQNGNRIHEHRLICPITSVCAGRIFHTFHPWIVVVVMAHSLHGSYARKSSVHETNNMPIAVIREAVDQLSALEMAPCSQLVFRLSRICPGRKASMTTCIRGQQKLKEHSNDQGFNCVHKPTEMQSQHDGKQK